MRFIQRFFFKRQFLRKLAGESWVKEAMAEYSLSVVPELENLQRAEEARKEEIEKKIAELGENPSYNSRQERKAQEKELEQEKMIAKYKADAANVMQEAAILRAQVAETAHRREVVKRKFSVWK